MVKDVSQAWICMPVSTIESATIHKFQTSGLL